LRLWVARLKGGLSVEHPIAGDELRAIKRYLAIREDNLPCCSCPSGWRSLPAKPSTISCGSLAKLQSSDGSGPISRGYYLADKGTDLRRDYLGHRDPKHTTHYTPVAGHRFEGFCGSR
jgi:type 1 fimbriae regulatory protein FimB